MANPLGGIDPPTTTTPGAAGAEETIQGSQIAGGDVMALAITDEPIVLRTILAEMVKALRGPTGQARSREAALAVVRLMVRLYDTWASWRLELGWRRWRLTLDLWYLDRVEVTAHWQTDVGTIPLE